MKIKRFKNNDGFATSDALIAVLIIALFTGIIATLLYNIYLSNASLKRMSKANGYIVDVFEYIDKIYYDDVNKDVLTNYFNSKYYYQEDGNTPKQDADVMAVNEEESSNTQFKVIINVQNYNEIEGNEGKLDLVKQVKMSVTYKLGGKDQTVEMKKIKSREKLISPNKPDLSLLILEEGKKAYSIKELNDNYVVCNENDSNWYSYENNKPAQVIITTEDLAIGDIIDKTDENIIIYQWIPRYAQNTDGDIKYLYNNTDKYVGEQDGYEKLLDIEEGYSPDYKFENTTGIWELI